MPSSTPATACIALLAAVMLTTPTLASEDPYRPVVEPWLGPAVDAVQERLPPNTGDAGQRERLGDALDMGAYRSALTFLGEALAEAEAAQAWETAQREPEPAPAFFEILVDRLQAQDAEVRSAVQAFGNRSQPPITLGEAEPLMVVAHLLVRAEQSNHEAASFLAGVKDADDLSHPVQRYTLVRPLTLAALYVDVAANVLESVPGGLHGRVLDVQRINDMVAKNGGTGDHWRIPEAGPLHALARHVAGHEGALASQEQNATLDDLRLALSKVPDAYGEARGAGLTGLLLAAAHQDAAWWEERAEAEYNPAWDPLVRNLYASVEGARYETYVLQQAVDPADDGWSMWVLAGGGLGGAALVAAAALLLRRRWTRA